MKRLTFTVVADVKQTEVSDAYENQYGFTRAFDNESTIEDLELYAKKAALREASAYAVPFKFSIKKISIELGARDSYDG